MVRVFLKGGVWKNSEDEILKAAVQKYGKQQWARVASLLNKKTAKQSKARWHEWLDPSIRKTEWSRAEEEKLLHLAKLMPAQWKTVAPLVGRTATQCQEHYEALLDQAAAANNNKTTDATEARQQATLRPGQIDSHPETKPARPDPIDMDEDEMEMLQEARARLANTQGKKAKRKDREKMLAQAKRLADLQKRRELKQAGLMSKAAVKKSKKSKKEIDLGVEIPFHKPAPAGFHDTGNEVARAETIRQKRLKQVDFQKLNEDQYRSRDRDASKAKKKEESRLRILEQSNEQYKQQKEVELPVRHRGILKLPEPTVTDAELSQIAKMQQAQQDSSTAVGQAGSAATQALLGDYSDRPLPTPMRTPASASAASMQQNLMHEASQLRMLERGQTPLLLKPGDDADDMDVENDQDDRKMAAAATPNLPDREGVGRTPGSVAPPRDHFGLNRPASAMRGGDDAASVGASTFASSKYSIREVARQERRAAKRARQDLEAALAALPAPQFEYELAAPADMDVDDNMIVETVREEDQADVEAAELERLRMQAEKLYESRNSVVKRKELPRPVKVTPGTAPEEVNAAKRLIQQEMTTLLQHDAHAFPVPPPEAADGKKKKKRKQVELMQELPPEVPLDYVAEDALNAAKESIEIELDVVMNEKVAALLGEGKASSNDEAAQLLTQENDEARNNASSDMVYREGGWMEPKGPSDTIDSLRLEFETLQEAADALRKKNDKLESKLSVMNGGYTKRADKLRDETLQTFADLQNSRIEESVYRTLQSHEDQGGTNRIDKLTSEIAGIRQEEAVMQKRYGDLVIEKRRKTVKNNTAN